MATFTSKAAGLASSAGATTWNESGVPANGDTVTIEHAVDLDYNITLAAINYGVAAANETFTISAEVTVTGSVALDLGGGWYDAAQFNTLHFDAGGKLIFKPGSGQSSSFNFGVAGKARLTGDVWIEFDDSDGGVSAYMTRGGVGFAQNFRTCMLDCDSCTLINMGTSTEWGGRFTYYGSTNRTSENITCTNSSLKFEKNSFFDYTGVLTIDKLAIDTPIPVGGLSEGLTINVDTAVVSRVVARDAYIYLNDRDTAGKFCQYFTLEPVQLTVAAVDSENIIVWDVDYDNPHADLPAGDKVFFEMPKAEIATDPGDLYPAAGQTNTRLIVPPIRTGPSAGLAYASIHLPTGAAINFTLDRSVIHGTNIQAAIYSGENSEGSAADKIAEIKNSIFHSNGGYVVKDLAGTPAEDAYPAAAIHHNLFDSRLDTGIALGIHSTINSSGGTYNANGQTKSNPQFRNPAYFATWGFTQNATTSDDNSIELLLANPSLIDDCIDFLFEGWQCTDAEADATGEGGVDMGVGYYAASSPTPVPIRSMMTMTGKRRILVPAG